MNEIKKEIRLFKLLEKLKKRDLYKQINNINLLNEEIKKTDDLLDKINYIINMTTKGESDKVSENISRYCQKQYERFINSSKKGDIQGAFFESIPEPKPKYEDDTLYSRLKSNPRKRSI